MLRQTGCILCVWARSVIIVIEKAKDYPGIVTELLSLRYIPSKRLLDCRAMVAYREIVNFFYYRWQ